MKKLLALSLSLFLPASAVSFRFEGKEPKWVTVRGTKADGRKFKIERTGENGISVVKVPMSKGAQIESIEAGTLGRAHTNWKNRNKFFYNKKSLPNNTYTISDNATFVSSLDNEF